KGAEARRESLQSQVQTAHAAHAAQLAALDARREQLQQTQERHDRLTLDAGSLAEEEHGVTEALARAAAVLQQAEATLAALAAEQPALVAERDARRAALSEARTAAQALQHRSRELQVQVESRRSTAQSVSIATERMREQHAQLLRRRSELDAELAQGDAPIQADQARLNQALEQRLAVEGELAAARAQLEEAEAALRRLDEQRLAAEQQVHGARETMDAARLSAQETHVRRAALAEQFAETHCELAAVLARLPAAANVAEQETALTGTRADLERLGQVNLAAIDELKDLTQRKEYLDRQFADLTAALGTLEEAMRRIDKETRTRFEDTFERINAGLREKFPRLFGGGHAYLELVGEDKLSAGVAVMARPPGKKNSTIHLLSGGEKALTAVALVFSIFDLNPAPFCLLDEVDAPLDEHNVGRFCDIVREMSSRVQFVFITHNKSTMELASQLIGVTMNEPGVSRLVTVDVDEAVRLAAV
ncbi:MAG: AAA family ATPase, partial [Gammaproteobacteria bacterium]|nr:AAA family ATPase [Gammaproteobacteria bacterium]